MRPKSIKLQKKTGKNLCDIDPGNDFLAVTQKNTCNKSKNKQVGGHQTKKLSTAKEKNQSEKES